MKKLYELLYIFAWRKFPPFLPPALIGKNVFPTNCLSHINDYMYVEPMVMFTT